MWQFPNFAPIQSPPQRTQRNQGRPHFMNSQFHPQNCVHFVEKRVIDFQIPQIHQPTPFIINPNQSLKSSGIFYINSAHSPQNQHLQLRKVFQPFNYKIGQIGHNTCLAEQKNQSPSILFSIDSTYQQINCVICERSFKQDQFQSHLELHRRKRQKSTSKCISIKDEVHYNNVFNPGAPAGNMKNPQMLFSFRKLGGSISFPQADSQSSSLENSLLKQEVIEVEQPSNKIKNSQEFTSANQEEQVKSNIRYFSNNQSIHQTVIQPQIRFVTGNDSRSQMLNFSSICSSSMQSSRISQNQSNQRFFIDNSLQTSNKGQIIIQNQTPSMPSSANKKNSMLASLKINKIGHCQTISATNVNKNVQNQSGLNTNTILNTSLSIHNQSSNKIFPFQICSREDRKQQQSQDIDLSQSSVNSIREDLEHIDRNKMIQHYNTRKKKIDLSQIIGLSENLARQGFSSSEKNYKSIVSSKKNEGESKCQRLTNTQNLKMQTTKSVYFNDNVNSPRISSLESDRNIEVQRNSAELRQIYRGTQVNESELDGAYSSQNNLTASKASTKSRLPKNYFALGEFIDVKRSVQQSEKNV